jgi:glycosyltransferase involved in cell wall biosynthesis
MKLKRLSVVFPTWNCRNLLDRHLTTFDKWSDLADEIIVVDSHSNDGTLEIIKEKIRHPGLVIIERDRGLYESWNEGIAATTGKWIYISTAGDTIEREHLLHLIQLGEETTADVVISSPKFTDSAGSSYADQNWPPSKIIKAHGKNKPFVLDPLGVIILSYLFCPQALLGSSASNLYKGNHLRNRPFPVGFRGAGDTVWVMRNANETTMCFTPKKKSTFCVHDKILNETSADRELLNQRLLNEKRQLALSLRGLNTMRDALAKEIKFFEIKNKLHAKRRSIWHGNILNPINFANWIVLTTGYIFYRTILSIEHNRLKNFAIGEHTSHHIERAVRASSYIP